MKRVLFYLALAVVCYLIAMVAGGGVAFGVFLTFGAVAEILFWKELFWPSRRSVESGGESEEKSPLAPLS